MENLAKEIAFYESKKSELMDEHLGEWVLVHESDLIGTFASFELAAQEAVKRFGAGPYLIRQIGASPIVLPASVMYNLQ